MRIRLLRSEKRIEMQIKYRKLNIDCVDLIEQFFSKPMDQQSHFF